MKELKKYIYFVEMKITWIIDKLPEYQKNQVYITNLKAEFSN